MGKAHEGHRRCPPLTSIGDDGVSEILDHFREACIFCGLAVDLAGRRENTCTLQWIVARVNDAALRVVTAHEELHEIQVQRRDDRADVLTRRTDRSERAPRRQRSVVKLPHRKGDAFAASLVTLDREQRSVDRDGRYVQSGNVSIECVEPRQPCFFVERLVR